MTDIRKAFGMTVNKLSAAELSALAADVELVRAEMGDDAETLDAAAELRNRIGGPVNLRSYVDCLMVKR